jgi:hypothetical protein
MTKLTSLLKTLIGRFLPLSGGTMTGIIKLAYKRNDRGYFHK